VVNEFPFERAAAPTVPAMKSLRERGESMLITILPWYCRGRRTWAGAC
jgi:hypothetical protein